MLKLKTLVAHEKWFDVPDNKGVRLLIREVPDDERTSLCFGIPAHKYGDVREAMEIDEAYNTILMCRAIAGWEGVLDEDGSPAALIKENKRSLLAVDGMGLFVFSCEREAHAEGEAKRAEAGKN